MDERCGFKRLAGFFMGHSFGGQLPQLIVYQRQKLFGGVRIALLDGEQNVCDLVHSFEDNQPNCGPQNAAPPELLTDLLEQLALIGVCADRQSFDIILKLATSELNATRWCYRETALQ
jgi:hypothetical protein